jgi:hypothetical protein
VVVVRVTVVAVVAVRMGVVAVVVVRVAVVLVRVRVVLVRVRVRVVVLVLGHRGALSVPVARSVGWASERRKVSTRVSARIRRY